MKLKYAYASESDWQDKAERKIYAQMMRYVITSRGRTTALKITDDSMESIELDTLSDDDLTPENGFYLLGHNIPVTGMLQKEKGRTSKAISFKEDESGQVWAILKWQWTCRAMIPTVALTPQQATALNAEEVEIDNHPNHYMVPALPIDMSSVINSYSWDSITEIEPTWKIESEN